MQHRQRKQLSSIHNINNNGCELNQDNDDDDDRANAGDNSESDAFLTGEEAIKMSTFHSSPALSASALSNQTNQTNCDDDTSSNHKLRFNNNNINNASNGGTPMKKIGDSGSRVLVHSASASAGVNKPTAMGKQASNGKVMAMTTGNGNSIDSLNSLGLSTGGSKKRVSVFLILF